jgi:hypothetical protein
VLLAQKAKRSEVQYAKMSNGNLIISAPLITGFLKPFISLFFFIRTQSPKVEKKVEKLSVFYQLFSQKITKIENSVVE